MNVSRQTEEKVDGAQFVHRFLKNVCFRALQTFSWHVGDPMGALPKAGYGAAAYIMQVLKRPGVGSTSVLSRTFLVGLLS
jgi:hypothetical protein